MSLSEYTVNELHIPGAKYKTWRIVERNVVNIYLITGSEKALVLDTGYGNIDLQKRIKELTDLPYIVLNSHGHPDHSGGNSVFGSIYANLKDTELIHFYSKDDNLEIKPLEDNSVIDLGDRLIEVMFTPGHTAGSISLFDRQNKVLFTSDTCNLMTWVFLPMCIEFSTYLASLYRLESLLNDPETSKDLLICPGHNQEGNKTMLADCIACAKLIASGKKGKFYHADGWGDGLAFTHKSVTIVYNPDKM